MKNKIVDPKEFEIFALEIWIWNLIDWQIVENPKYGWRSISQIEDDFKVWKNKKDQSKK